MVLWSCTRSQCFEKKAEGYVRVGLDEECVSNHSLRATGVSWLYESGISEKLIMERSGHLSVSGVRMYKRTTAEQQKVVSDVLSNRKPLAILDNVLKEITVEPPRTTEKESESSCSLTADEVVSEPSVVDPSEVLKNFSLRHMDGCTFNFHFGTSSKHD